MPIPKPREGEKRSEFAERCMTSEVMQGEFPKKAGEKYASQRYAVCMQQWRDKNKKE